MEKVKAFVETTISKPDIYGNTSALCTVTNPHNGASITFQTHGTNGAHLVCRFFGGWEGIKHTEHLKTPIRDFNRMAKGTPYEHQIKLENLFSKERQKV